MTIQSRTSTTNNHPVQFERISLYFVACLLCGAVIRAGDRWKELHRNNHDVHNEVHSQIDAKARRFAFPRNV